MLPPALKALSPKNKYLYAYYILYWALCQEKSAAALLYVAVCRINLIADEKFFARVAICCPYNRFSYHLKATDKTNLKASSALPRNDRRWKQ